MDVLQTALSLPGSRQASEFVSLHTSQWGGIVFLQPSCCVMWSCLGLWGAGGGAQSSSTCSAHAASDKETAVSYWPEQAKARTGLSPRPLLALCRPRAWPRDSPRPGFTNCSLSWVTRKTVQPPSLPPGPSWILSTPATVSLMPPKMLLSSASSTQGTILSPHREDQHPPSRVLPLLRKRLVPLAAPGYPLSQPLSCLADGCPSTSPSLCWLSALPCGCPFSVAMVTKPSNFITSQSGGYKSLPKCQHSCHPPETLGTTRVQSVTLRLPICPSPVPGRAATPLASTAWGLRGGHLREPLLCRPQANLWPPERQHPMCQI